MSEAMKQLCDLIREHFSHGVAWSGKVYELTNHLDEESLATTFSSFVPKGVNVEEFVKELTDRRETEELNEVLRDARRAMKHSSLYFDATRFINNYEKLKTLAEGEDIEPLRQLAIERIKERIESNKRAHEIEIGELEALIK